MRKTQLSLILSASLAAASLSGCGSGGRVAAVVNGQVITAKEVDDRLSGMSQAAQEALGGSRGRVLEQMIMEALLLQEARRRGLENDKEVKQLIREARRQILFGRLVEVLRSEKPVQVPEEEIAKYYEEHRADFAQPDSTRAGHILTADEETAKKALSRIKAGEPFAKVAEEMSTDPSRTNGGDIGFFAKGQVIPEFEEACRRLKAGEVSDVIKSSLGWHVIQVTERREARERALDEVKDRIARALEQRQRQKNLEQVVQGLRSRAQVVVRDKSPAPAGKGVVPPALPSIPEKTEKEAPAN